MIPKAVFVPPPVVEGTIRIEMDLKTAGWVRDMIGDVLGFNAPAQVRYQDVAVSRWGQCATELEWVKRALNAALAGQS